MYGVLHIFGAAYNLGRILRFGYFNTKMSPSFYQNIVQRRLLAHATNDMKYFVVMVAGGGVMSVRC